MKKRVLGFYFSVILIVCLFPSIFSTASAISISSFDTDDATGWSKWGNRHMGKIYTTYSYAGNEVKASYSSYINSGIDMWGSNISCTEVSSNAVGTFTCSMLYTGATASTTTAIASTESSYNSSMHITSWRITIYEIPFNLPSTTTESKIRTMAHEIGHAFGLGHVSDSSQIMYGESTGTKNITAADVRGMKVMTHVHTHTGDYNRVFAPLIETHKERCTTCRAVRIDNCSVARQWHEGSLHYYKYDCICGNQRQISKTCTSDQCMYQYQKAQVEDIE